MKTKKLLILVIICILFLKSDCFAKKQEQIKQYSRISSIYDKFENYISTEQIKYVFPQIEFSIPKRKIGEVDFGTGVILTTKKNEIIAFIPKDSISEYACLADTIFIPSKLQIVNEIDVLIRTLDLSIGYFEHIEHYFSKDSGFYKPWMKRQKRKINKIKEKLGNFQYFRNNLVVIDGSYVIIFLNIKSDYYQIVMTVINSFKVHDKPDVSEGYYLL